jgi:hypothetical protein
MPEIFIWAAVGAVRLIKAPFARAAWTLAPIVVIALPRLVDPIRQIVPVGNNGDPYQSVIAASQLLKNASPTATVAVISAGIVPYFTHLRSIDLLGKTDAHIARLQPVEGAMVGHGKVDPTYSFAKNPDYIVSLRSKSFADSIGPLPPGGTPDYAMRILASEEFRQLWKPNPVSDPYLLDYTAVYVGSRSPEIAKLSTWMGVVVAP